MFGKRERQLHVKTHLLLKKGHLSMHLMKLYLCLMSRERLILVVFGVVHSMGTMSIGLSRY